MEGYASKLMMLIRKRMNTPIPERSQRGYTNPVINNTGGSASRIQYSKEKTLNGLNIDIIGDAYLENIDSGGKPPTGAQVQDIAQWIVSKPVDYRNIKKNTISNLSKLGVNHPKVQYLARKITAKINAVGIEPTGFITKAVEEHLKNLKLVEPVVADVRDNVEALLMEAGFDLKGKTIKFV